MKPIASKIIAACADIDWAGALSDAALRGEAGPGVFQRGQTYAASGAVQDPALESRKEGGIALRATVMGTQPYQAEVIVSQEAEVQGDCDCPHAQDGYFCKHQVALALTLRGMLGGAATEQTPEAQKKVAAAAKRAQTQAKNREAQFHQRAGRLGCVSGECEDNSLFAPAWGPVEIVSFSPPVPP